MGQVSKNLGLWKIKPWAETWGLTNELRPKKPSGLKFKPRALIWEPKNWVQAQILSSSSRARIRANAQSTLSSSFECQNLSSGLWAKNEQGLKEPWPSARRSNIDLWLGGHKNDLGLKETRAPAWRSNVELKLEGQKMSSAKKISSSGLKVKPRTLCQEPRKWA